MNIPQITSQIRKELKSKADPQRAQQEAKYFKETIKVLGVPAPQSRSIAKDFYSSIKGDLTFENCKKLSGELLKSGWFEEGIVALELITKFKKQFTVKEFGLFETWVDKYVSNWAHCDELSAHLIGELIEKYPALAKNIIPWTKSKNRWKRRSAAVSLVPHVRRGKYLNEAFKIADNLMLDSDDMVQKGVGWLLKEASKSDQKRVFDYLMKWKDKTSRVTLRYAIEKFPENLRQKLLKKE